MNYAMLFLLAFVFGNFDVLPSKNFQCCSCCYGTQNCVIHLCVCGISDVGLPRLCILAYLCTTCYPMSRLEQLAWRCLGSVCLHGQIITQCTNLLLGQMHNFFFFFNGSWELYSDLPVNFGSQASVWYSDEETKVPFHFILFYFYTFKKQCYDLLRDIGVVWMKMAPTASEGVALFERMRACVLIRLGVA